MTLEWPISRQRSGHLYLSIFCRGQQIGTSPHDNVPLRLGHNSATGPGHRGAQSLALQEESGPEPLPGGLDADSDVVPTVRCQWENGGVKLSAWVRVAVCVCVWMDEKKEQKISVYVGLYVLSSLCKVFSHTRLMAGVEVVK